MSPVHYICNTFVNGSNEKNALQKETVYQTVGHKAYENSGAQHSLSIQQIQNDWNSPSIVKKNTLSYVVFATMHAEEVQALLISCDFEKHTKYI